MSRARRKLSAAMSASLTGEPAAFSQLRTPSRIESASFPASPTAAASRRAASSGARSSSFEIPMWLWSRHSSGAKQAFGKHVRNYQRLTRSLKRILEIPWQSSGHDRANKNARRGDALRRQSTASGQPFAGGSSRIARLDPLSLPVRLTVPDERTDDG